jgi:hypothetical protein
MIAYGRSKHANILHAAGIEERYGLDPRHPVYAFSLHLLAASQLSCGDTLGNVQHLTKQGKSIRRYGKIPDREQKQRSVAQLQKCGMEGRANIMKIMLKVHQATTKREPNEFLIRQAIFHGPMMHTLQSDYGRFVRV